MLLKKALATVAIWNMERLFSNVEIATMNGKGMGIEELSAKTRNDV